MLFKTLFLSALPALTLAQTQDAQNLTEALASTPDLSTLASLVRGQPSLLSALGSATNITILAPNNAALASLVNSSIAQNSAAVQALLSYHVLRGNFPASVITNTSSFIPTLLNDTAYTNVTGGQRVQALLARGNVTLISGLLQNSTVTTADKTFQGGTIHIINKALTLPSNVSQTLTDAGLSAAYGALKATNLLGAINGLKDVTIFAPNNSAFGNIASILSNASAETLQSVLRYHIVNGTTPLYSSSLSNTTVNSLGGGEITVRIQNGSVFVNNAKVITPDVLVAGGVVHIIDQVLNPGNSSAAPTGGRGVVAFEGASSASDTPFTSGVPTPAQSTGGGAAAATSTSSTAGAAPMMTAGPMGVAALIGAGVMLL